MIDQHQQEVSNLSFKIKDTRKRTKLGNGYLLEFKKQQQAKRRSKEARIEEQIKLKNKSMVHGSASNTQNRVLVLSEQFVLPNSSKLIMNSGPSKQSSQSKLGIKDRNADKSTAYGSTTNMFESRLGLESSAVSTSENSYVPPVLDYHSKAKITSDIEMLEEKARQQELKVKYGTNMNKKERIEAQQKADQSLIDTIMAKFTLTDTINHNTVYNRPQNLDQCQKPAVQTDHFGNKFTYDMAKEENYRGQVVWKVKKKGLNGMFIDDTPFNSLNLTQNSSQAGGGGNQISALASPKNSIFNPVGKDKIIPEAQEKSETDIWEKLGIDKKKSCEGGNLGEGHSVLEIDFD